MIEESSAALQGRVLVVGASGGIGEAIASGLAAKSSVTSVYGSSRGQALGFEHPKLKRVCIDFDDQQSLVDAASLIAQEGHLSCIVVATGMLHDQSIFPERSLKELDAQALSRVLAVNTIGPALLAKHFVPLLAKEGPSVLAFLGARIGSISDNRAGGWYSYRASKAALMMLVKTLSIELRRTHPQACAICLHPGTVRSSLSEPFVGASSRRKCFSPQESAQKLISVLHGLTPAQSGLHLDYAGLEIPG